MPSSPDAPRATVLGAFLEGWRRTLFAPAVTLGVLVATLLTALPGALLVADLVEQHLGASVESERLLWEWRAEWADEFAAGAEGIGRTFTHEMLGFGGTLATVSRLLDHESLDPSLVGFVAAYALVWLFLSGGILDRLARGRPVRAAAFFSACGAYFPRFLRLALLLGACYWGLFRWLHPLLFVALWDRLTRDVTAEHQAMVIRAGLYAVFLLALMAVSLLGDFTKVRMVVEDRRSAVSAIGAATRFVRRRAGRVVLLYLLNIAAALVVARLWIQIEPAANAPTWTALAAGQAYLLLRVWAKLAFMASEVAFFQGELAHGAYTAAPEPRWPDSAGVEAIRNLRKS